MRIASVSIDYPSPWNPYRGLFIQRRIAALARLADVSVINPVPWFPIVRAWPGDRLSIMHHQDGLRVLHRRMFYLPGILKGMDSHWVKRSVLAAISELEKAHPIDAIDAHFGYPEGAGCVRAALAQDRPVFITMRGLERPILGHRWRGKQLLWALGRCTGIITVAESLKALAVEQGIAPGRSRSSPTPSIVERSGSATGTRPVESSKSEKRINWS